MNLENVVLLVICAALCAYLLFALLSRSASDMTANGWFQIFCFLLVVLAITKPLGIFMARVFNREKTFLDPVLRPIERLIYRLTGVDDKHEMRWTEYAVAMLLFSGVSMALLYLIERTQQWLPAQSAETRQRRRRLWRSTPPRPSPPTPTGKPTAANRP